ncbi:hypothetical protein TanjilG_00525 [Lupinus angustifolius]|uniref:Copia protein n=1 Tax=Lupinus angustifolius TaxID=3871 RepID=A0A4P1QXB0_LUPAN|nr:hypothetical protein TanjilG_00525 [Lupinus angustifolius]
MELDIKEENGVELLVDSKSAIDFARNHVSHGRSKHIETKCHYLRQQVAEGMIKLIHCKTKMQLADMMTKALRIGRFKEFRKQISVHSLKGVST